MRYTIMKLLNSSDVGVRRSGYIVSAESVYAYHVKRFGHPSEFGYKDLIPLWKAEKFDAHKLYHEEVGIRFIGAMAIHHDNFDFTIYFSRYIATMPSNDSNLNQPFFTL